MVQYLSCIGRRWAGKSVKVCDVGLIDRCDSRTKQRILGASTSWGRRYFASRMTASFSTSPENGGDVIELLPPRFLREADEANYDASTLQRTDVRFDMDDGKPLSTSHDQESMYDIRRCTFDDNHYTIEWGDGRKSRYAASWIEDTVARWREEEDKATPRILWSNLTEEKVRQHPSLSLPFPEVMNEAGMARALKALYQYGFVLVTDTPLDDNGTGIAALASALSGGSVKKLATTSLLENYRSGGREVVLPNGTEGPLRTLYGSIWSTSSSSQADGASVADSAYGKGSLPLHTDMTYHRDPPGLQIFTMVQPALHGGESVFADGFAVADFLRSHNREAFAVLSSIERTYRCLDKDTGWNLQGKGPVISTTSDGTLLAIRHNDLDRLPDLPPFGSTEQESDEFYTRLSDAHHKWNEVLAKDEFRLVMSLEPGDTAVVANHRCFHARYSFRTDDSCPRVVMGCYVSQDELNSRFRMQGFRVFS